MTDEKRKIARAFLEVYAFRADRDDDHLLAVKSYMLAVAGRLLDEKPLDETMEAIDSAACALERAALGLRADADCSAALAEIAPDLVNLRRCPMCGLWRAHSLNCRALTEPNP